VCVCVCVCVHRLKGDQVDKHFPTDSNFTEKFFLSLSILGTWVGIQNTSYEKFKI